MIKVKAEPMGAKHVQVTAYFAEGNQTPINLGTLMTLRGDEAREVVKRLSNNYADPVLELDGCLELPEGAAAERLERA
jgi:hypothetical protein